MSALEPFAGTIARLVAQRTCARAFLPAGLLRDPAWDALIDLAHSEILGHAVATNALAYGARVPCTTMLRWIDTLQDLGLVHRVADPDDGRRTLVALTNLGRERMALALRQIAAREASHA